jgi:hypothetical protein
VDQSLSVQELAGGMFPLVAPMTGYSTAAAGDVCLIVLRSTSKNDGGRPAEHEHTVHCRYRPISRHRSTGIASLYPSVV